MSALRGCPCLHVCVWVSVCVVLSLGLFANPPSNRATVCTSIFYLVSVVEQWPRRRRHPPWMGGTWRSSSLSLSSSCLCSWELPTSTWHGRMSSVVLWYSGTVIRPMFTASRTLFFLVCLRCRYHSNLRLPLIYPHPYRQITVETEFDNPLYETGGVSVLYVWPLSDQVLWWTPSLLLFDYYFYFSSTLNPSGRMLWSVFPAAGNH